MLHDGAEDHWLELLPFARVFCHRDEIGTEEHAADAGDAEQSLGERRLRRLLAVAQVERSLFEHRLSGQEFQGRWVWCCFSLDEHWILWRPRRALRPCRGSHKPTPIRGELRRKFKS